MDSRYHYLMRRSAEDLATGRELNMYSWGELLDTPLTLDPAVLRFMVPLSVSLPWTKAVFNGRDTIRTLFFT